VIGRDVAGGAGKPPRVLIIAGSDSGGGAGIQADIKTVTMLGGFAMTAITAITAQNTLGVREAMVLPGALVEAQAAAVIEDIGVDVVKIGMLGTAEVVAATAAILATLPAGTPVVLDPVMIATSGDALADGGAVAGLHGLMPLASVVTPNLPELQALTGRVINDEGGMASAATALAARFDVAVLAKGGHLPGDELVDLLVLPDGSTTRWSSARIHTSHTHGTGCTLASGIANGLGAGLLLADAVSLARDYVRAAILAAPGFGGGHGPMGHGLDQAQLPNG